MFCRLTRFYAGRRLWALVCSYLLGWLTLQLCGGPPEYFTEWPARARLVLGHLVGGTLQVSFIAWLYLLLRPFLWHTGKVATAVRILFGMMLVPAVLGAFELGSGLVRLTTVEEGGKLPVVQHWFRVAGLPVIAGSIPLGALELKEYLRSHDGLHRLWNDGQGHIAGWASLRKLRKLAQPLVTSAVVGGYYGTGIILGKVKTEDAYDANLMVVHESTPHLVTIAQPGGGKHIGAMPTYCSYAGSLIAISNKPEIADQVLGGRVDHALLPPHPPGITTGTFGIDPRSLSQTVCQLANSRSYVLDFGSQSVWGTNTHPLLSEIDVNDDNAQVFALAIADGSHPERPDVTSEPWFREGPRNAEAAGILHFKSTELDPRKRTHPYVIERLMGVDRFGESGPKSVEKLLLAMTKNRHPVVGSFIATTAVQILELGSRSYGCLKSGIQTHNAWVFEPHLRRQLEGPADFTYRDIGIDGWPVFLAIILPRGDAAMRSALPLMRAHAELCLQILQTRKTRPRIPTLFVADEGRQYLKGVQSIANSPTLLRDARVKLHLMFQSWPSVVNTLGQSGAEELEACSTMQYFAINDQATAERISRRLGHFTAKERQGLFGPKHATIRDVKTPAEVLRELSINSTLSYVMGGGMPPMRLERLAYKTLVTREGTRFQGLPLEGQYDEGLSRYTYGGEPL